MVCSFCLYWCSWCSRVEKQDCHLLQLFMALDSQAMNEDDCCFISSSVRMSSGWWARASNTGGIARFARTALLQHIHTAGLVLGRNLSPGPLPVYLSFAAYLHLVQCRGLRCTGVSTSIWICRVASWWHMSALAIKSDLVYLSKGCHDGAVPFSNQYDNSHRA